MQSLIPSSARGELILNGWSVIDSSISIDPVRSLAALGPFFPSARVNADYSDLRPHKKNQAKPFSMSAITGTDAQPKHTDAAYYPLPPRYVALQCLDPGEVDCPTHLWAVDLGRLAKDHREILTKSEWVSAGFGNAAFYCSIMDVYQGLFRLRFDPICMRPAKHGSQTAGEAMEMLDVYSLYSEIKWERGALLLIDNWRCLHARGSGGDRAPSRRLRRWYIGVKNGLVNGTSI